MATEIYICKDGQALKEGKLEYGEVTGRDDAEVDAKRRCQRDATIKKIAYYAVDGGGDFKCFYSYTNPNCRPAAAKPAGPAPKPKPKAKPAPKPGLIRRIGKALGLG